MKLQVIRVRAETDRIESFALRATDGWISCVWKGYECKRGECSVCVAPGAWQATLTTATLSRETATGSASWALDVSRVTRVTLVLDL